MMNVASPLPENEVAEAGRFHARQLLQVGVEVEVGVCRGGTIILGSGHVEHTQYRSVS